MESKIKEGDMVLVEATDVQLQVLGIYYSARSLRENPNKVERIVGMYSVVDGLTIPLKYLVKCEEK